ncbi:uncharacterized protein LOC129602110 [Paramacrobiotus metropolitanus]|uniref:uncharacterized protein LOC129602110 n=1 Tax=Paramacrobiotus metropolitanus TaxID=2943436 RepID=UPI002446267E|nr:uncharacterized protein LOC129602110 [Paramacrobiotus metropolitanus]
MAMIWLPWTTSASELRDTLYEIPDNVLVDLWNRLRPELTLWLGNDKRNINEKGYRLAATGYIQQLRMSQAHDTLRFNAKGHSEMKPITYNLGLELRVVGKEATEVTASECSCRASGALGKNALCKHIFAMLYAIRIVIDGGSVPAWQSALPVTSMEQQWGVPSLRSLTRELQPGRADLYAAFMRPDARHKWKPSIESRIHPKYRIISTEEMSEIRSVLSNTTLFPKHVLRLIEPASVNLRLPREPSPDLSNPYIGDSSAKVLPLALPVISPLARPFSQQYLIQLPRQLMTFYKDSVEKTHEDCIKIEGTTRLQAKSSDWLYHRSLRVTSTYAKRICTAGQLPTTRKCDRFEKLAKGMVAPSSISHIPAVRRESAFVYILMNRGWEPRQIGWSKKLILQQDQPVGPFWKLKPSMSKKHPTICRTLQMMETVDLF